VLWCVEGLDSCPGWKKSPWFTRKYRLLANQEKGVHIIGGWRGGKVERV